MPRFVLDSTKPACIYVCIRTAPCCCYKRTLTGREIIQYTCHNLYSFAHTQRQLGTSSATLKSNCHAVPNTHALKPYPRMHQVSIATRRPHLPMIYRYMCTCQLLLTATKCYALGFSRPNISCMLAGRGTVADGRHPWRHAAQQAVSCAQDISVLASHLWPSSATRSRPAAATLSCRAPHSAARTAWFAAPSAQHPRWRLSSSCCPSQLTENVLIRSGHCPQPARAAGVDTCAADVTMDLCPLIVPPSSHCAPDMGFGRFRWYAS